MRKRLKRVFIFAVILVLAVGIGAGIYLSDDYSADEAAVAAMAGTAEVTVRTEGRLTVFAPAEPKDGFIFYPGGKVEHKAYAPMLLKLAEAGVLSVLVEMPGKLAVLDANAAEGIQEQFPEVERWYLGGHSLGGSMAASYAADHDDELSGLVLLAAYSTADLSESGLPVLSIYGSEDRVLNSEKYEEYRSNLPPMTEEIVLAGGNHAGFGSYGHQEGDGIATILPEEQRELTADHMIAFFDRCG